MNFLRVWTCSRTHDKIFIKSEERKPLCPICGGTMSKARGDGISALLAQTREIEVEVFDNEETEIEEEEEPFEVFPEKPERITPEEPEQEAEPISLTPKEKIGKRRVRS